MTRGGTHSTSPLEIGARSLHTWIPVSHQFVFDRSLLPVVVKPRREA